MPAGVKAQQITIAPTFVFKVPMAVVNRLDQRTATRLVQKWMSTTRIAVVGRVWIMHGKQENYLPT